MNILRGIRDGFTKLVKHPRSTIPEINVVQDESDENNNEYPGLSVEHRKVLESVGYNDVAFFDLNGLEVWAKVVKIYDGDTCTVVFYHNDTPIKVRCRLADIDCAEKTSKDPAEVSYSDRATERLTELINDRLIFIKCHRFDKYHRLLIDIFSGSHAATETFNQVLINEGLAYVYDGGQKKSFRKWAPPKYWNI